MYYCGHYSFPAHTYCSKLSDYLNYLFAGDWRTHCSCYLAFQIQFWLNAYNSSQDFIVAPWLVHAHLADFHISKFGLLPLPRKELHFLKYMCMTVRWKEVKQKCCKTAVSLTHPRFPKGSQLIVASLAPQAQCISVWVTAPYSLLIQYIPALSLYGNSWKLQE